MKTAISLPDAVFAEADELAAKLHISRSELYVMALEKLIREHQRQDTTARINAFIEKHGQPVDPVFLNGSIQDLRQVEW